MPCGLAEGPGNFNNGGSPERQVCAMMEVTAFSIAERFVGLEEVPGAVSNPAILAMLQLDNRWPQDDEIAWCSAFVNYVAWLLRLPRSKSLAARSWLGVGKVVPLSNNELFSDGPKVGYDVVVLRRGVNSPGPEVLQAPGHVGFFAGYSPGVVHILGGNQGDSVNVSSFSVDRILGVRRLA